MSVRDRIPVRVAQRRELPGGATWLLLVAEDGRALPPADAGAHVDVFLSDGLVRQYSLCASPEAAGGYALGVLHEPASRGGSAWIWEHAHPGATLEIGLPRNLFGLQATRGGRHLLLAGGIGITPLLYMAQALHAAGEAFTLHYSCRSRAVAAFAQDLLEAPFAGQVVLHFDDEPDTRLDLAVVLASPDAADRAYVCGPAGFIVAAETTAAAAGWSPVQVHKESFAAEVPVSDGDSAFDVELRQSGQVLQVPAGRSIASVLQDAGVPVLLSCEQGVCGTCSTLVLDGIPDHRDSYLTPEERERNDTVLICCSRSRSARLVLDL